MEQYITVAFKLHDLKLKVNSRVRVTCNLVSYRVESPSMKFIVSKTNRFQGLPLLAYPYDDATAIPSVRHAQHCLYHLGDKPAIGQRTRPLEFRT